MSMIAVEAIPTSGAERPSNVSSVPAQGKRIPYGRQTLDEDDIAAVVSVLRGDWLTQGPAVARFEAALAERFGARHAIAVANGTVALHLACVAAGLGPGGEGITSPNTFLASANVMVYCGARPLFADIDAETWAMDPSAANRLVNERTRVLLPVDFAGLPADLEAFRRIADRNGLLVIEDACHSLGARYHGSPVGGTGLADMVCFSFHPVKHITTGEGGAVLTDDETLAKRVRRARHHGMTKGPAELVRHDGPWYYEAPELGWNGRITDIQCALGSSQLKKLDRFVERRSQIDARYREALSSVPGLRFQRHPAGSESAHHIVPVHLDPGRYDRRKVFEALGRSGIDCQVHYIPVHLQPYYMRTFGTGLGDCPQAERYYEGCLTLPVYPSLTDEDQTRVIASLLEALG